MLKLIVLTIARFEPLCVIVFVNKSFTNSNIENYDSNYQMCYFMETEELRARCQRRRTD